MFTEANHTIAPPFHIQTTTADMAGKFEPKVPVQLNPPKDDLISLEDLAKANGMHHFSPR